MDVPELFFSPVLGFVAHAFYGFVDDEQVLCVLGEHQFHKIAAYKAFFPPCIFSFGHTPFIALREYLKIASRDFQGAKSVTESNDKNCVTEFSDHEILPV